MPRPDPQELIAKLDNAVARLRSQLAEELAVQSPTKMATKVEILRQVLLHRASDLSGAALDLYRDERPVPACVLTRAVMETVGVLFWLWERVEHVCSTGALGDIDQFLRRAILGTRSTDRPVHALSALTAIEKVTSAFEPFRSMYDELSEYAHPNWEGVQGSYSSLDVNANTLRFGECEDDVAVVTGVTHHVVSLELALEYSEKIVVLFSRLTDISEFREGTDS